MACKKIIKVRPLLKGYVRKWLRCKKCKSIYYHDYIPYSLSTPIAHLPCNHDIGYHSLYDVCNVITEEEVLKTNNILMESKNV